MSVLDADPLTRAAISSLAADHRQLSLSDGSSDPANASARGECVTDDTGQPRRSLPQQTPPVPLRTRWCVAAFA
ncbi:hypothetical protein X566_05585 [Afipia sp. P52-10]|nr:hypothetical protein X566_05585 [Afipia sp. P52-10]